MNVDHIPEDMTVTVAAEVTLAVLQDQLRARGQWLPIDPPAPDQLTIRVLLDGNASGPRRYGYGTIREHLLGLQVRLADGQVIRAGGRVVKNVAGYDLCRLFVGARGTLGTILEATFKVRPLPEAEIVLARSFPSLEEAGACLEAMVASELTPVVLDLVGGGGVIGHWSLDGADQSVPLTGCACSGSPLRSDNPQSAIRIFWSSRLPARARKWTGRRTRRAGWG